MDSLEKYIHENRAAFDTENPRKSVWEVIDKSLSDEASIEQFVLDNRPAFDTEMPTKNLWASIENSLPNADVLEKYIKDNREAFDTEIPSLKVWAAIDKQVNPQSMNKVVKMTWWKQAAAAVVLVLVGAALGIYFSGKKDNIIVANVAEKVAPELNETENFYTKKVENQYAKLVNYNPDPSVLADLKQLDEIQLELKKELENAPNSTKEEIINRLIENYRIKLGILERVLNNIEENKSDNQKSQQQHEKI